MSLVDRNNCQKSFDFISAFAYVLQEKNVSWLRLIWLTLYIPINVCVTSADRIKCVINYDFYRTVFGVALSSIIIMSTATLSSVHCLLVLNKRRHKVPFSTTFVRSTLWGQKLHPYYFCANFVKPQNIFIIFGTQIL